MGRQQWPRRTAAVVVLLASLAWVLFLVREGRTAGDQWSSILAGIFIIGSLALSTLPRLKRSLQRSFDPAEGGLATEVAGNLLLLRDGTPPRVEQVEALDIGVKPAISNASGSPTKLPDYLTREADLDLEWAIAQGGPVLLHGPAASGKTRSAFEVVKRLRPSHTLLIPNSAGSLQRLLDAGFDFSNCVIWLDDLERFLAHGGLDEGVIQQLCPEGRTNTVLLATIRNEELTRMEQARIAHESNELGSICIDPSGARVVAQIRRPRRVEVSQYLSQEERILAERLSVVPRIRAALRSQEGFAEYLAAGPELMRHWTVGEGALFDVGQATISAAVDCRRAGFDEPLSSSMIAAIFREYLSPARRSRADLPPVEEALAWACQPILGASSCLIAELSGGYVASDYLLDRTQMGEGPLKEPITNRSWDFVISNAAATSTAMSIGATAYREKRNDVAGRAFRIAADQGDANAKWLIGALAAEDGDDAAAETWYAEAANLGSLPAMNNIGTLLLKRGEEEQAAAWFSKASSIGSKHAAYNMAVLNDRKDKHGTEAEKWYRVAALRGHFGAMRNLGVLLVQTGREDEAEHWWRLAATEGHSDSAQNLGILFDRRGETQAALSLWRQAADRGHAPSMVDLALALRKQGHEADAEQWYRKAAEKGDARGMANLGKLLWEHGYPAEAAQWSLKSANVGSATAMFNLGVWAAEQGNQEEATVWYRRAAEAGETNAMSNLGVALAMRGQTDEAEVWLCRSADGGNLNGLVNLGMLKASQNYLTEAAACWRRAAEAGNQDAVHRLQLLQAAQQADEMPDDRS